jgi:hypothetical protein
MSVDFAALTAAVGAGLSDVRACLIVSRDGLALGSYPPAEEGSAMAKWMRLVSLGDVERGFAVVGEECWVFCSRGPYSALAVARASARPGLILERLDQMVLAAEEARLRKEGLNPMGSLDAAAAARRRRPMPPTGVHPGSPQMPDQSEQRQVRQPGAVGVTAPRSAPVPTGATQPPTPLRDEGRTAGPSGPVRPGATPPGQPAEPARTEAGAEGAPEPTKGEDAGKPPGQRSLWVMDVDDLTREFAGLLGEPKDPER